MADTQTPTTIPVPITTIAPLPARDLVDLIITAVEHAGYGTFDYTVPSRDDAVEVLADAGYRPVSTGSPAPSERIAAAILAGDTVEVTCRYDEEAGADEHPLNLDRVVAGITAVCERRGTFPANFVDNHDVVDADAVMQIAVYDDVIYG